MVEKSKFPKVVHNDYSQVNLDVNSIEHMTVRFPFIQFVTHCKTQKAKSYEHNYNSCELVTESSMCFRIHKPQLSS